MVVSGTFVFSMGRKMSALLKEAVAMEMMLGDWFPSAGQLLIGVALRAKTLSARLPRTASNFWSVRG